MWPGREGQTTDAGKPGTGDRIVLATGGDRRLLHASHFWVFYKSSLNAWGP